MGAWIEIFTVRGTKQYFQNVALFMGAWIEILPKIKFWAFKSVALFMGAWIEMT